MTDQTKITATTLPTPQRAAFIPALASPRYMMNFEGGLFNLMGQADASYTGGFWEFVKLSNGGAFAYPRQAEGWEMASMNYWSGHMSDEAAGIAITICVCSLLSFKAAEDGNDAAGQKLSNNYYMLRDYAAEHAEAAAIFAFID
jgi:hypothetical protein